jgi:hypothetical protein
MARTLLPCKHMSTAKAVAERIEDAIREVGTLLVALAPLDMAFGADRAHALRYGLIFEVIGVSLFLFALFLERRHSHG